MKSTGYPQSDARRHERRELPVIAITFEGKTYNTVNWSLGGFLVEGYMGSLTPGALFNVDSIRSGEKDQPVLIRARVVRVDAKSKQLVVGFLDIDDRAYSMLQDCMAERNRLLRGA